MRHRVRPSNLLGSRIVSSTILYWATWHFVAQNWGILRIYQRKSGEAATSLAMRCEKPLLMLSVLFCLAHRMYTGPHKLFCVKIFHPTLPYAAVLAILVDTSAFAAAACWHGLQYLGMVRHYNKNAWRGGVDPNARIISWLSQPGWTRALLYMALLFALAGSVYAVVYGLSLATGWSFYKWAGIVWVSLTLSHYWIDGVIWKLRRPELAARVGIATP